MTRYDIAVRLEGGVNDVDFTNPNAPTVGYGGTSGPSFTYFSYNPIAHEATFSQQNTSDGSLYESFLLTNVVLQDFKIEEGDILSGRAEVVFGFDRSNLNNDTVLFQSTSHPSHPPLELRIDGWINGQDHYSTVINPGDNHTATLLFQTVNSVSTPSWGCGLTEF